MPIVDITSKIRLGSLGGLSSKKLYLKEYRIYNVIKQRCYNIQSKSYCNYGARGIRMSDEWRDSFYNFIRDIGKRPSPEHSIDRIDNNLGYSKENCRWSTRKEQARNKRSSLKYEFRGDLKTLQEWCEILDMNYKAVFQRIKYQGWDIERALTTTHPIHHNLCNCRSENHTFERMHNSCTHSHNISSEDET